MTIIIISISWPYVVGLASCTRTDDTVPRMLTLESGSSWRYGPDLEILGWAAKYLNLIYIVMMEIAKMDI